MTAALKARSLATGRAHSARQSKGLVTTMAQPSKTRVKALEAPAPAQPPRHLQAVSATPHSRRTKVMAALNTGLSALTGLMVVTALGSYGYNVYIERQLDQAAVRLAYLQRNEQQLTTVNEVLKNHMAQQAERPNAGLRPPQPTNVIFLKPAQKRTSSPVTPPTPNSATPSQPTAPLGY